MEREKKIQMNVIIFGCVTMLALSTLTQSAEFSSFTFTREPSDAVVAPGSSVTIHCNVRSDSVPIIQWLSNDRLVPTSDQRFTKFSNGSLRIRSLSGRPSVSGRYSCQVEDQASTMLLISREAVVSIASLELASDPADVSGAYAGDTARFECPAEGQGTLEFVWQKNGRDIDLTEERVSARFRLLPSGTLEIQDLRSSDEGSYRCRVSSPFNLQETSRQADLTIRRGSPSSSRPFEFTKSLETSIQRTAGSPVILEVSTSQPATFRWYKNDAELSLPGDHYTLVGQGSLYIEELQEIHTAIYRVVAEAMDGSQIESSTSVLALVPPSFVETPVNKAAREGDIVVLPCRTYGIPNPDVVWLKDGDPIRIGNAFKIVQGNSLSIDSALISDSGFYQCVATNDVGNIQGSMELLVLGPGVPFPELPLPPSSSTSTRIPTSTVRSTTSPGPTTNLLPIDPPSGPVPSMPVRTSVSRVSARTAFVNWDPPRTTNGEIIQYRIALKAVNDPSIRTRIISVTGETSKLIADLRPNTEYSLQILARNDNGLGENSDPINFITREAVQVPEQPQNLDAMVQSSSSVLVTWEPPIDTFGDLLGYRLFYAAQDGLASREEEILVTGTSKVVEGLEPYTVYGFRVLAVNENGRGASTGDVQVKTFSAKPGTPPANFSAESSSTSSITLRWNPPWTQQNGAITEYRIKYRMLDEKDTKAEIKVAGSLNSFIVSELERNSIYEFKIAAVTVNGTGPYTEDWLQEYTRERDLGESKVPGEPSALITTGYLNRIEVYWAPPEDRDTIVRGYLLSWGKGIPGADFVNILPSTYSYVIYDLVPHTMYIITLKAFNNRGEGQSKLGMVETREEETEAPPTPLNVVIPVQAITQSQSDIRLAWTDSNSYVDDQRPTYTVIYREHDPKFEKQWNSLNTTEAFHLFENLKPYTTYAFAVKISLGSQHSPFSLEARNTTLEAVPSSPPTGLSVHSFENSSSLLLMWNAPEDTNGVIRGYVIYYTSDQTALLADWDKVTHNSNLTTATLDGLEGRTNYYVRVQGRNGAGLGPISLIVPATTGAVFVPPVGPEVGGTPLPPQPESGVAGFPWWLWLIALALVALILLLALLLLLCALCGCFKCCASMCPCCGDVCGAGGCFGQCCQALARCWASCCPCCCSDEEECAGFCSKLCCGACTCCAAGAGASSSNKNGAATAISGGSYKSNGPDVLMSSTTETETDNLIKANGEIETGFGGTRQVEEPLIKKSTGYFEGDRGFIREHHSGSGLDAHGQNITYNTTNVHVSGEANQRGEGLDGVVYDDRSVHSEVRSQRNHGAITPVTSISTQMVTYPGSVENGADPFTITFEETTTSHCIEKSVPLLDGTNYKTISNHETHSKSYSTSDASKDRNLQHMLQNGLESGPLAIDVPSTRMEPLSALTAPVYSTSTLGRGNSSLDSYSSSSHNNQATMSSTVDTNLQASKATTNLQTFDSGYRGTEDYGTGLAYHVELPSTLPRGSNFHTSFEEHSESRLKNYGSGTMPGRVEIATRHMEAADGQVLRSEESKESFPYLSDVGGDNALTMSQLDSLTGKDQQVTSSHYQSSRHSTDNHEYHLDGMRTVDSHRSQMSDSQYGTGKSSFDFQNSGGGYGTGKSSLDFQDSGAYGTGKSSIDFHQSSGALGAGKSSVDFQNTGTGYRYTSNASLDRRTGASLGNLAPSRGRLDYHTIDRSEGIDRLENLRRLTNKVLSSSSTRLSSQNNGSGLNAFSSEHLDGGHSDGYESNYGEKRMYHARSGSSGYQSTGNLLNGGARQYSFNNNNSSPSRFTELDGDPSSSEHEDNSSDNMKIPELPTRVNYSQSRDGLVKVSPSPNAHRYLAPNGDLYRKAPSSTNPLERSQSIANHIGRDFTSERRVKSSREGVTPHHFGDTQRRLMRSFSLDRINAKQGYHSDTTLSSGGQDDASVHSGGANRPGNPNLSSFTVPGPPPPHYQTGPSRVRISAPTYSPLKRTNQPGTTVKVRAQPLPVVTPKAPDVTYRANDASPSPESAKRTFSTEDLNAEMQHLEGLMKDLNAITASELESN